MTGPDGCLRRTGSLSWLRGPRGGKEAGRGLAERTLPFNYPLSLIGLPASPPAVRKRPLFAARVFTKQMVLKAFIDTQNPFRRLGG